MAATRPGEMQVEASLAIYAELVAINAKLSKLFKSELSEPEGSHLMNKLLTAGLAVAADPCSQLTPGSGAWTSCEKVRTASDACSIFSLPGYDALHQSCENIMNGQQAPEDPSWCIRPMVPSYSADGKVVGCAQPGGPGTRPGS
jgi:hypothetical protein